MNVICRDRGSRHTQWWTTRESTIHQRTLLFVARHGVAGCHDWDFPPVRNSTVSKNPRNPARLGATFVGTDAPTWLRKESTCSATFTLPSPTSEVLPRFVLPWPCFLSFPRRSFPLVLPRPFPFSSVDLSRPERDLPREAEVPSSLHWTLPTRFQKESFLQTGKARDGWPLSSSHRGNSAKCFGQSSKFWNLTTFYINKLFFFKLVTCSNCSRNFEILQCFDSFCFRASVECVETSNSCTCCKIKRLLWLTKFSDFSIVAKYVCGLDDCHCNQRPWFLKLKNFAHKKRVMNLVECLGCWQVV